MWEMVEKRLPGIKKEVSKSALFKELASSGAGEHGKISAMNFNSMWNGFVRTILPGRNVGDTVNPFSKAPAVHRTTSSADATLRALTGVVSMVGGRDRDRSDLDRRLKNAFYGYVTSQHFTDADVVKQKEIADMRWPAEWFPATRELQRTIHLHVGPTNSGKTYQALKRLEEAEVGLYAGPLRLLAHEVYMRMNAKGIPCALLTGEERRPPALENESEEDQPPARIVSSTVEMLQIDRLADVAVIDEIQMIGDAERGWAWTTAVLAVRAKEVHLCGEARTVPLIKELCAATGDKLEVHEYQRLSPLQMEHSSLDGDLSRLRKGDCVVSFSVMGIHALRQQIERVTKRKVATVYGSLPPETRAQQARLFNDPNNDYDYLVASDAIGMGLNLAIKRVIFETSVKFDGQKHGTVGIAEIKQIGGRAGRFRTSAQVNDVPVEAQSLAAAKGDDLPAVLAPPAPRDQTMGLVTTLESVDYPVVATAMASEPPPILTAGIDPPSWVLERFATYFPPGTPFSYLLSRIHDLGTVNQRFHLTRLKDQLWIADLIEPIRGLTVRDRHILCLAPASSGDADLWNALMPALARCVVEQRGGDICELREMPIETLDMPMAAGRLYLRGLERLHKGVVAYMWLSYRFAGIFTTRATALHLKSLVEAKIEEALSKFSYSELQRKKRMERRAQELEKIQRADEARAVSAAKEEELKMRAESTNVPAGPGSEEPLIEPLEDEVALDAETEPQTTTTSDDDASLIGEVSSALHDQSDVQQQQQSSDDLASAERGALVSEEDLGLIEARDEPEQLTDTPEDHETLRVVTQAKDKAVSESEDSPAGQKNQNQVAAS